MATTSMEAAAAAAGDFDGGPAEAPRRSAKKKSSSSRRHHRDGEGADDNGERRSSSRRKKSSSSAGRRDADAVEDEAPGGDDNGGERKKKKSKSKHHREDETPEEREERRRRRREKKQAKAEAEAASAPAAGVPAMDDIPDDRLPRRVIENPPVPLSDSEHEDVVEIVERRVVAAPIEPAQPPQPPSRPPKPATMPKPAPPALKPKPKLTGTKPIQQQPQPPPPQPQPPQPQPPQRQPPAEPARDSDDSDNDRREPQDEPQRPLKRWNDTEDIRYQPQEPPLNRWQQEDEPDDATGSAAGDNHWEQPQQQLPQRQAEEPQQQQYGRRPPPPPVAVPQPNPQDPASLHRYLAETLEDSDDELTPGEGHPQYQQQQQQQQQYQPQQEEQQYDPRYQQQYQPQYQQQYPTENAGHNEDDSAHDSGVAYRQADHQYGGYQQQQQPDPEQRFSELVEADMAPQEPPPIPEGKKPGGGGLLGKLFSSFRRGGSSSSKRKPASAAALAAAAHPQPHPQPAQGPPDQQEQPGLAEQGKWRSNPSMFNANEATPGNTLDPRMPPSAAMMQQQQQMHMQQRPPPPQSVPGVRTVPDTEVRVILLDGEEIGVPIPRKATGAELMARVCEHMDVQETDYFGLTYVDAKERMWFWLDSEKKVLKQLKHCDNHLINFQVKFYPPEPSMLFADVTRYQLCLQVRQDIYTGKLPCTWVTQALLGSFQVQSELGDYDQADHGEIDSIDYLQNFEFVHNQTPELVRKIAELHRGHKGVTPEVADLRYLETARRLEFYGVDLHPARDLDDVDITIGVCFGGVLVYKDRMRISRFAWPKILRISYRKNLFYLKIRSDLYDHVEAVIGFKLMNHKWAKRLWKIAIENHAFFRLKEAQLEKSSSRTSLNFIRGNSSHRFSGRTMHQYRNEAGTMRHSGTFDRSLTKRMSASLPSLKGSQYGSFHSLNRLHPRDMRPQGGRGGMAGSVNVIGGSSRGGGGLGAAGGPRVMARTGSVSILPTNAFNRPPSRAPSTTSDDVL